MTRQTIDPGRYSFVGLVLAGVTGFGVGPKQQSDGLNESLFRVASASDRADGYLRDEAMEMGLVSYGEGAEQLLGGILANLGTGAEIYGLNADGGYTAYYYPSRPELAGAPIRFVKIEVDEDCDVFAVFSDRSAGVCDVVDVDPAGPLDELRERIHVFLS